MSASSFTVMLPTWLFSEAELRATRLRITDAIEGAATLAGKPVEMTEMERICLGSIDIELAFRNSAEYTSVAETTNTLMQEPKS